MKSTKSSLGLSRGLSDTVRATLSLLFEAADAERHLPCEPHGFACQIENLIARGATETALRELLVGRHVEHLIETTTSKSPRRTFAPAPNRRFWVQSSFALTASGILLATRALAGNSSHPLAPQFDPQ